MDFLIMIASCQFLLKNDLFTSIDPDWRNS